MQIIRVRLVKRNKGCESAPIEILNELKKLKSKENGELIYFDKLNLEEIHVDLRDLKEADWLIEKNAKEIFYKHDKAIFVGGDRSLSYPVLKSFIEVEKNPLLIVFDAHSGFDEERDEGWLRKICENDFCNVILISSRNLNENEIKFIYEKKIVWIKMDILREDIQGVCDIVMERARESSGFYVSVDIDCVDPGFAPGTSDVEVGGLTSGDLIYFIKRLKLLNNFRGGDIVEINPEKDINKMTVKLGARILGEMI